MTHTVNLIGCQTPTYSWTPVDDALFRQHAEAVGRSIYDAGTDAVDFARRCGLFLDPWQSTVLRGSLGEYPDEQWVTNEVGLIVPRQNGKGAIIEARELAGIFLFGDRLIMHSAHLFPTARDAFTRMKTIIEANPDLDATVLRIDNSKGEEGFTFRIKHETPDERCMRCRATGRDSHIARLRYITRSAGGGRGFTGVTTVILDEVMILDDPPIAAMLPTMATEPKWQVWYTGSAGDVRLPSSSVVQARARARGWRKDPSIAHYEWFAHIRHTKDCPDECVLDRRDDPKTWAKTNPSLGMIRPDGSRGTTPDFLRKMLGAMASWDFDREFLSVGEYPADDGWSVIRKELWETLAEVPAGGFPRPMVVGIECAWDWSSSSVTVVGERDGLLWMECIANRPGTSWVPEYCAELKTGKKPAKFVLDKKGPARILIPDMETLKVPTYLATTEDAITWSGKLVNRVTQDRTFRHLGQESMTTAVRVVTKREFPQGQFTFERADTPSDVTPWIAGMFAYGGWLMFGQKVRRRLQVATGGPIGGRV